MTMMKVWSQAELYPPTEPAETRAVLDAVLTDEKVDGKNVLKRLLTVDESSALIARRHTVVPFLQKGRYDDIGAVILEMMVGFPTRSETDQEAAVKAKQYCDVVADQPLWAIKRACDRFAQGSVTAEDLGEKGRLSRAFVPSTAHLYRITTSYSRPFQVEAYRIRAAVEGVFRPRSATEAGRKQVEESLARFKRSAGGESGDVIAQRDEARKNTAALLAEGEERQRLEQFYAAGVDPHPVLTLTFLFSKGYTIVEHPDGGRVLLAPTRAKPRSKKGEKLNETSGDEMVL